MIYYIDEKSGFAVEDPKVRAHIAHFLGSDAAAADVDAVEATARGGQTEVYSKDHDKAFSFCWVGIRCTKKDRLIGAVVIFKETGRRYFFALEITPHEYEKTLVGNQERLKQWRERIKQFILQLPTSEQEEEIAAAATSTPRKLVVHKSKFIVLDATQESAMQNLPATGGVLLFGRAGTGKTVAGIEICRKYAAMGLRTLFVAPTRLLADQVNGEFSQDVRENTERADAICYDDFLTKMSGRFPNLHLLNHDNLPEVNGTFFEAWCREHIKNKPTKKDISHWTALWHEFCHVIMQPDWSNPERSCLNITEYCALGKKQSIFSKDTREDLYNTFFAPFFRCVSDEKTCYSPVLIAQRLYNELRTNPLPEEDEDKVALVMDEGQKYHAWQAACLLQLVKDGVHGHFVICGDANQGVESQKLQVAAPFLTYLSHHKATATICHLSRNHRNSIQVAGVVGRITRIEDELFGALEYNSYVASSQQAFSKEQGHVELTSFSLELRDAVAADADAYIVVPDEEWQEKAAKIWPSRQIVTLLAFSGMSVKTIIMVGFTEKYKTALDALDGEWGSRPFSEQPLPFGRPSELKPDSVEKRECLQGLSTAAARATGQLIIVGEPHRLIEKIIRGNGPQFAEAQAPMPERKLFSLEDWFNRAQHDYAAGLQSQAMLTLTDKKLWGAEKVAEINTLINSGGGLNSDFFAAAEMVLFPKKIAAAEAAQQTSDAPLQHRAPKDHSRKTRARTRKKPKSGSGAASTEADEAIDSLQQAVLQLPDAGDAIVDCLSYIVKGCEELNITFKDLLYAPNRATKKTLLSTLKQALALSDLIIKSLINTTYMVDLLISLDTQTISELGGHWVALGSLLLEQGTIERVRLCVSMRSHASPLDLAIYLGHPKLAQLLLSLGAQVNTNSEIESLSIAAIRSHELVKILLDKPRAYDKSSPQPLMSAIIGDNTQSVRLFLQKKFATEFEFKPTAKLLSVVFPVKNESIRDVLSKVTPANPLVKLSALEYCKLVNKPEMARIIVLHTVERRKVAMFLEKLLGNFDASCLIDLCSKSEDPDFFSTLLSVDVEHNGCKTTLHDYLAQNPAHLDILIRCYLNTPYPLTNTVKMNFSLLTIPGSQSLESLKHVQQYLEEKRACFQSRQFIPPFKPEEGYPLHIAAFDNNLARIGEMIGLGANPDLKTQSDGGTPLFIAAECGKVGAVLQLMGYINEVNAHINSKGHTPLFTAVLFNHKQIVSAIAKRVRYWVDHIIDYPGHVHHNYTALSLAAEKCNLGMVDVLIEAQAPVDPKVDWQLSPLCLALCSAAEKSEGVAVLIALIKSGAKINKINADTLLVNAVILESQELLRALAEKREVNFKENIEIRSDNYQVIVNSSTGKVKERLRKYSNLQVPDCNLEGIVKITPLELAVALGFESIVTELREIIAKNTHPASGQRGSFFAQRPTASAQGTKPREVSLTPNVFENA